MIQEPEVTQVNIPTYNRVQANTGKNLKTAYTANISQFQQNQSQKPKTIVVTAPTNRTQALKTRIIRVPFLPRSEQLTLIVKRNPITTNGLVSKTISQTENCDQSTQITQEQPQVTILTDTDYNYISNSSNYSNSEKKNSANITLVQELPTPVSKPMANPTKAMTLASMAGIQLTSTDSEFLPDMSGAMPTATVEEINVPVFIDEYLQQSAPTLTTEAATAATTIINNNQPNNSNNGNGNDICIEVNGTYDNFDFDIDMIAQNIEEQMYSNASNNNNNTTNNINNYSNNNMNNYMRNDSDDHFNFNIADLLFFSNEIKEETKDLDLEQQFHLLPNNNINNDLITFSEDTFNLNFGDDISISSNEEAVDISQVQDDIPLSQILTSSQHNPMLCSNTNNMCNMNSQTLFANFEPMLSDFEDFKFDSYCRSSDSQTLTETNLMNDKIDTLEEQNENKYKINNNNNNSNHGLKRSSSFNRSTSKATMAQKRRKLFLDTTKQIALTPAQDMKTPDVVNLLSEFSNDDEPSMRTSDPSEIINDLLNASNSSFHSVDTELLTTFTSATSDFHSSYNDDEAPNTPHSCSSYQTNQTSFAGFATLPNSPAPSSTSTSNTAESASTTQCSNRKKRGRPSKQHSDRPNPEQMKDLDENERKRLEDRYKNNEASRQSRLKNKLREEAEMEEEKILIDRNQNLKAELAMYERRVMKFKNAVKKIHFTPKS